MLFNLYFVKCQYNFCVANRLHGDEGYQLRGYCNNPDKRDADLDLGNVSGTFQQDNLRGVK